MAYIGRWAPLWFGAGTCLPLAGCVSKAASGTSVLGVTLTAVGSLAVAALFVACIRLAARERARAQQLEAQLQAFEQAINALDVGFAVYDQDERLVLCNQVYMDMCLVPADLRNQKPTYEQVVRRALSERPESHESLPPGMALEERLQKRLHAFRNPTGAHVVQAKDRFIQVYDHKTQGGGVACTRTDVTTIKRAEFAARVQEKRLEMAAAFAGIGVWETDLATAEVKWDARMELMHGYDAGTFPGTLRAWKTRVHPEDLPALEVRLKSPWLEAAQTSTTFIASFSPLAKSDTSSDEAAT